MEEKLIKATQWMLEDMYGKQTQRLTSYLEQNVGWIDSSLEKALEGREQVINYLDQLPTPVCHVKEGTFYKVGWEEGEEIVSGMYKLYPCVKKKGWEPIKQRATFLWKKYVDGWKVRFIQLSVCPEVGSRHILMVKGTYKTRYFIYYNEIIYIEAFDKLCEIVCRERTIKAAVQISKLEEELPSAFVRIHRSYIVNGKCVVKLQKNQLQLCNGLTLPVAEKRYRDTLESLKTICI